MILKRYIIIITLLFISVMMFSCASFNIRSEEFLNEHVKNRENKSFYITPIKVTSSGFYEDEEIAYIIDKKLSFSLKRIGDISIHSEKMSNDLLIIPELIIKRFESNYMEKGFYMIILKVFSYDKQEAEFRCQYNGSLSIFDAEVQDVMIKRLMNRFKKYF